MQIWEIFWMNIQYKQQYLKWLILEQIYNKNIKRMYIYHYRYWIFKNGITSRYRSSLLWLLKNCHNKRREVVCHTRRNCCISKTTTVKSRGAIGRLDYFFKPKKRNVVGVSVCDSCQWIHWRSALGIFSNFTPW